MEPITLCGLIIVMIGLWVELESVVMAVVRVICKSKLFAEFNSHSTVQRPVCVRRMPICLAKGL